MLIITEFPPRTPIRKTNFPKRNRIIAGLSQALLIIEAASRSGALITATLANDYNRDVFACPGKIGDRLSAGCNNLISSNRAHLVISYADIADFMGWCAPTSTSHKADSFQGYDTQQTKQVLNNVELAEQLSAAK